VAAVASVHAAHLRYNQVIRPWKSRLGLFYTQRQGVWLDLQLIAMTVVAIISRPIALKGVQGLLRNLRAAEELVAIAGRTQPLVPFPPPGADAVETRY
jgi:hypothetical protein